MTSSSRPVSQSQLSLRCLSAMCRLGCQISVVLLQMVNSLLSSSERDRLESVELERTLNHMADAVYCPRCSTISIEDQDNCAQCSKCFYDFCSLCSGPRHPGVKCLGPAEKLELMRHRMAGNKAGEAEFRKREAELQNLALIQVRHHMLQHSILFST